VDGFHGGFALVQVDDDADLDLAGGDHVDVDAGLRERFKQHGCDAGVASHADADDGELSDLLVRDGFLEADLTLDGVEDFAGLEEVRLVGGEADVGGAAGSVAGGLDDHVHVDGGVADGLEDARGHAGLVRDVGEGDLGLVLIKRDAANDDAFHVGGFFFHEGSGVVVEAGADFEHDAKFLGELDAATLHDFRAEAGELEHLVVGNLGELLRVGDNAGVGGIDAIDIGVNLAEVGLQRGGEGDGGEVGTAAAERGDLAFGGHALEARDDDDVAGVEKLVDFLGRDVGDLGLGGLR